jgi:hypothetical protein
MLSIGLWRWYINVTATILDRIRGPVFNLKHSVSETGFCLRLQENPIQLGPIDRASLCLRTWTTTTIRTFFVTVEVPTDWYCRGAVAIKWWMQDGMPMFLWMPAELTLLKLLLLKAPWDPCYSVRDEPVIHICPGKCSQMYGIWIIVHAW